MNSLKSTRHYLLWTCLALLLLPALVSCSSTKEITIKSFGPVEPGGTVEINKGIGVAVDVDNPDDLPIIYKWTVSRGAVRVSSDTAPAGTYEASDTPGTETITVEVMSEGKVLAQKTVQIEVVPAAVAQASLPPARLSTPTELAATASPADTATLTPTTATSTESPPADTATPVEAAWNCESFRNPIRNAELPGEVQIKKPQTGDTNIPVAYTVGGTHTNVPENLRIWVLVYPHSNQKYYPQSNDSTGRWEPPAPSSAGGNWSVGAYIGREGFKECFDIVAVVANEETNRYLIDLLGTWADANDYPGLFESELPAGIMEKSSVTVETQGE